MDRIKEELIYLWKHSFLYELIFKIKTFFRNFKLYLPILLNDQWWDYGYFEDLIIHKLKDIEKHWGKDTHYEGDCFTKKRIQVLLKKWEKIKEKEDQLIIVDKEKQEWFKELGRLLPRLWD